MYDIRQCTNAESAIKYLAYDEPGIDRAFGGKGFEHLGIAAEDMDMRKFNQLIRNQNPVTGESLTPRNVDGRICGWYLTFSPPKDVTLLAQFSPIGDKVREALREAGDYAMKRYVENKAQVRERKSTHADKTSANMMWVRLHHTLDRPEKIREPIEHIHNNTHDLPPGTMLQDRPHSIPKKNGNKYMTMPQDHLHYFAINASFDKNHHKGPRFVATKMRNAFWDSMQIKLKFHKRLRENLEMLGIETAGFGMKWKVPGIDRATIDRFSIRRDAARKNNAMGVPRAFSGLVGRADKQPIEDLAALKFEWKKLLTPRDLACLRNITPDPKTGRRHHPGRERMRILRFLRPRDPEIPKKEASDRGISIV
ncbi:MAG: relaxase domain-containing protein [Paludisphaera borealis]|uniref:relaxase domain-containing protein n=1 Tax=Paludisphaera borealis TaxID=1387353 RepID=UPI0028432E7C|nr:relaxase domain-containing protein [Paludisphaera borealis]MDR3620480.1 relaxase domain-containing protein [Paludisphaera borealis]